MRSYQPQTSQAASVNDENIARHPKKTSIPGKSGLGASAASASDRREVLGDVTQLKNEQGATKHTQAAAAAAVGNAAAVATTNPKVQIYKQQYHHQFKKPRLERILQRQRQRKDIPIHSDATDDEDAESKAQLVTEEVYEEDDDDDAYEDIEDDEALLKDSHPQIVLKKNGAGANAAAIASNYHNNSEDILIRKHFDKLSGNSSLSPEAHSDHLNNSDYVDEDISYADKENQSPVGDENDLPVDKHKPMEPIWTKSVFNELQFVINKYSRVTLDENDEDTFDVTMVAEYAPEIFNYMHELENRLVPDATYMDNQDELKWEMRSVLIDWVVQVHSRFNLLPETLFLTVNYIDRFLSKRKVSLSRFQLVGAVALFIAAKYEEINCPTVQEVAYMADNAYSIDDFLKAERFMIDVLEFDMGWPGPMSFLRRTSKADDYDYETRTLAKYFLEITIMDSRFVASQPSWLAAGAHYLSRRILNKGEWTELHVFYSGYTEAQLRPLAEVLLDNCRHAETHHKAIFEKYQERRYRRSSAFVQEYFSTLELS